MVQWFFEFFDTLSKSRTSGLNSLNPISISDIIAYSNIRKPIINFELTLDIIQSMDLKFLASLK